MCVQIPRGEIGIEKSRVKQPRRKPVQERLSRLEASDLVVFLGKGHRARNDPNASIAQVGQGADAF